jgi:hypothetical protein
MSNRFHNKFHRHNHHTRPTDPGRLYPDSAYDPIASRESPFQGEFYLDGDMFALSSVSVARELTAPIAVFGNATVTNNFTVLGESTVLDTYVFCSSAVEITNSGTTPALTVTQTGNAAIAKFVDADEDKAIIFDTVGQVGIGTLVPTSLLHLRQMNSTKNADILVEGAYSSSKLLLKSPLTGEIDFTSPYGTYANITGNVTLSSLAFKTTGVERINIISNGNVGIGTDTPGNKLDVRGIIQANYGVNGLGFFHSNGTNSDFRTEISANLTTIKNSTASLAFATANAERARIDNSGNVGVGTITPASVGGYTSLTINSLTSGGRIDLQKNGTQFGLIYSAGTNLFDVEATGSSTDMRFNTNLAERVRITADGNVGIGTAAPVTKLHVNGSVTIPTNNYLNLSVNNGDTAIQRNGVANGMEFFTASASRMFIADGGNVGVGNNNPTNKFHVTGTTLLDGVVTIGREAPAGLEGGQISLTRSLDNIVAWNIDVYGSDATPRLRFFNNTEKMCIINNGNVGIGTTAPNTKLTVVGDISANGSRIDLFSSIGDSVIKSSSSLENAVLQLNNDLTSIGTGPLINFQLGSSSIARIRGNTSLSAISFETNNTERVRISDREVNIYANLTIQGDLSSTGNQYFANTFFTTTSAISVVNISPVSDTPALYIGQSGLGDIASFYDLDIGVEVLHVGGANGSFPNVGIKMSNPGKDFTVNGEISAKSTIWDGEGNSVLWNSVYNAVKSLSATWLGTGQLVSNTVGVSAASTFALSQSSTDIEILAPSTAVTTITAFTNGVKGITYTLTNKTNNRITIQSSPNIIIRRGNAWRSNTTSLNGAFLVLPLSGSCSVRADQNFVSVW